MNVWRSKDCVSMRLLFVCVCVCVCVCVYVFARLRGWMDAADATRWSLFIKPVRQTKNHYPSYPSPLYIPSGQASRPCHEGSPVCVTSLSHGLFLSDHGAREALVFFFYFVCMHTLACPAVRPTTVLLAHCPLFFSVILHICIMVARFRLNNLRRSQWASD